jgi:hypothetical protein
MPPSESRSNPESPPGPAIDRLLRAASPALASELERMIAEHGERLRAEANVQLRKALLDKEAELRTRSEAELARARAETAAQARQEVTRELESRFEGRLASELRTLRERLDDARNQAEATWQLERTDLRNEAARWQVLADFSRHTGEATSQAEILKRFLRAAGHFAGDAALYLNKAGGLRRWKVDGHTTAFPEIVSEDTRDPDWYWSPVRLRSRMVLAVGAMRVENRDALDALVGALRRAIETLGLRLGSGEPEPVAAHGDESGR